MGVNTEPPVVIPKGFKCSHNGVIFIKKENSGEDTEVPVTFKQVKVQALSRDDRNENWGRLVHWTDHDDNEHKRAIPSSVFHAAGNDLAQMLASGGLPIVPGSEKHLMRYLTAFVPKDRLIAATGTGWHGDAFVLPSETINEPNGESIVFQPAGLSNTSKAIHRGGTLEGWQTAIKDLPAPGIFFVCASLSAPLRLSAGIESGGFHLYGVTSHGKTTIEQGAASVWGDGVDPSRAGGKEAVIQRWNSTSNALEAKAEAFNDLPLIIDEIGEGDSKSFGQTIYRILSGTGRGRAKRDGTLADSKTWRTMILSAGELPVAEYIIEGGTKVRGGQLVRLVDIPLFETFPNANVADHVKAECAKHFGHAGPALIKSGDLMVGWHDFNFERIGRADTNEAGRVRKRFALAVHAGLISAERGILPWSGEEIVNAVSKCYEAWLNTSVGVSDAERGIGNIVDFLLAHGASRFERPDQINTVRDRAGWYRDGLYHFTPKAFKEACAGAPDIEVRKALNKQHLLHLSDSGRLMSKIRVDGVPTKVVSVKSTAISVGVPTDQAETGTAESLMGKGLSPPYPVYPVENDDIETKPIREVF